MSSVNFDTYVTHYNDVRDKRGDYSQVDLPEEFNKAATEKVEQARALVDRVKQIQSDDKGVYKLGRGLRAACWGALGAVGLITVVPALAYMVMALILDRDPLNWSHRLSLKPKEQLEVEDKWDWMCKNWQVSPLQNPYTLPGVKVTSENASTATPVNCTDTKKRLDILFNSNLEDVERLSKRVMDAVAPLSARTITVQFPKPY